MCHSSSYNINYQSIPGRNRYFNRQVANTYWRIKFIYGGVYQTLVITYNSNVMNANFMHQVQQTLSPYGVTVETVTLMIPAHPRYKDTPSEIVIANQRDFLRALPLIPASVELYNPTRGVESHVNKDKVTVEKYGTDSGYNSETSS